WDELVGASKEIAPTTLQGVNQRVIDLSTIVEQETTIMYGMMEEAQDDRSQLRGRVNLLYRDRPVHHSDDRVSEAPWTRKGLAQPDTPGEADSKQAPLSPDYVPGPEEPEQAPPSPVYLPYVPELVYSEYMPPEDNVFPVEEQLLPVAATPTTDSPGYILEFDPNGDPEEDEEEDPEEDPANYPADSTVVALPAVDHVPSEENEPTIARDDPYSLVREEIYGFVDRVDVAPGRPMSKELGYGITDTWDELVGASKEIAPTTL
nr:hypothetical protein [Tanacetum cinerariifolium]